MMSALTNAPANTHAGPAQATPAGAPGTSNGRFYVALGIALWFVLAAAAVWAGLVQGAPGQLPLPVLVAVMVPILLFLLAYRVFTGFRAFVLGVDVRLLTILQSWRVAGVLFLALYAYGVLPGFFAFPAGLGDLAVGVTAPIVALALLRRPDVAAGRGFVAWNLLGIFDFVVAVGTGTLASGAVPGLAFTPTTAPVTAWPLGLIPAFLVPLFAMLHLAALFQARQARR